MSLPPYELIVKSLRLSSNLARDETIPVPEPLLRYLISQCISTIDIDRDNYARRNPDVFVSLRKGETKDAKQHYANYGYFEGRAGALPPVDEAWYLKVNPDVAAAVKAGEWQTGQQHWDEIGKMEWRSPTRAIQASWTMWMSLLGVNVDKEEKVTS